MGLTKEVLKEGNGSKPTKGQEVSVHCTGYGKDRDLTKVFWCKLVKKEKEKQKWFNCGGCWQATCAEDVVGPSCVVLYVFCFVCRNAF